MSWPQKQQTRSLNDFVYFNDRFLLESVEFVRMKIACVNSQQSWAQDIGFSGCLLTLWRQLDPDGTGLMGSAPMAADDWHGMSFGC